MQQKYQQALGNERQNQSSFNKVQDCEENVIKEFFAVKLCYSSRYKGINSTKIKRKQVTRFLSLPEVH